MDISKIKFGVDGLIPAIAQDAETLEVLMLAYMNAEALTKTLSTGKAHFFSRSRKKLWLKGETSGNFLDVKSVYYDCDADALLLLTAPYGPACHTGEKSCFYSLLSGEKKTGSPGPLILRELSGVIESRKTASSERSYVASLFSKGLPKILDKIQEESGELIEAGREKTGKDVIHETVDLWFHTMVLLSQRGIKIVEVWKEFGRRFGASGIDEKNLRGKDG
ncbi:MAG: bifunctional phosphoribosyl-AMP cyclohydrolase/phosphoribosyl-ATP diphosphatase HisIE [Deltaproteobacteria bacterium]|nr:bifunctional phosphoribosyl-AMP cyclohydrolase/phosphoribosyl-ATP diphosphatase HisIE [Deltaproteobacteria bacterium]